MNSHRIATPPSLFSLGTEVAALDTSQPAISDVGIAILAVSGHFQQVNPTFSEITNIPLKQLIGCHYQDIPQLDYFREFSTQLQKLLQGELEVFHFEALHRNAKDQELSCLSLFNDSR